MVTKPHLLRPPKLTRKKYFSTRKDFGEKVFFFFCLFLDVLYFLIIYISYYPAQYGSPSFLGVIHIDLNLLIQALYIHMQVFTTLSFVVRISLLSCKDSKILCFPRGTKAQIKEEWGLCYWTDCGDFVSWGKLLRSDYLEWTKCFCWWRVTVISGS